MYLETFRLTKRPFLSAPDPALLYASRSVKHAIIELEKTLRHGQGIGLLTSEAGTGKTLLCKTLADSLEKDPLPVLLLNANFPTRSSLLQAILFELNRPYQRMTEQELRLELVSCGREIAESATGIALLIDEAHLLSEHILEELRSLTNFMHAAKPIFRVVLFGQLPLEEMLTRSSMESFNHRLVSHVGLDILNQQESLEFILTRVKRCGGTLLDVFHESALELIIHAADGSPRCLNQLCDHSCLLCSIGGDDKVTPEHVREALEDLQKLPLRWNTSAHQSTDSEATIISDSESEAVESPTVDCIEIGGELEESSVIEFVGEQIDEEINPDEQVAEEFAEFETGAETESPTNISVELCEQIEDEFEEAALDIDFEAADEDESPTAKAFLGEHDEKLETSACSPEELKVCHETEEVARQVSALAELYEEQIHDRYAILDARRLGQIDDLASTEPELLRQKMKRLHSTAADTPDVCPLTEAELEVRIGESVLDLCTEVASGISESDEDYVPSPENLIPRPIDSQSARGDVIHPQQESNFERQSAFDKLYRELRNRRKAE